MNFSPENIFTSCEKNCPYIDGKSSTTKHYLDEMDSPTYEKLLLRGWRRFGKHFFTPSCANCIECTSIRIPTEEFVFSRSYKRILKANKDTKLIIRKPTVSKEHMEVYAKYHDYKSETKGWEEDTNGTVEYYTAFVECAKDYGYEYAYYVGKKLVAVALVDMLPMGVSAVYCYYDPNYNHLSLGTYSILKQIEIAKENKIPYLYLGYWIAQNASLTYKSRFKPHEILLGRPSLDDEPVWIRAK